MIISELTRRSTARTKREVEFTDALRSALCDAGLEFVSATLGRKTKRPLWIVVYLTPEGRLVDQEVLAGDPMYEPLAVAHAVVNGYRIRGQT